MANIKQKFIKPGRDYNYSEGVKVLNSTASAIAKDTVLFVNGYSGPFLKVIEAKGNNPEDAQGRLFIAKNEIPASGYGVALPWRLVTGSIDMSGATVGDPVYAKDGGGLTLSAGGATKDRIVGHVVAATNPGAYLFSGELGTQEL